MKPKTETPSVAKLVEDLGDCFTPETAKRVLAIRADSKLQSRIAHLANRCTEGTLTEVERAEYGNYVAYGTFLAILKSKARQLLAGA